MARVWLEQVQRNAAIFYFDAKKQNKNKENKMYRNAKKDSIFLITRGSTKNHSIDFENASVIDKGDNGAKNLEP